MAGRALYYPYIHIRDGEWLKGALLLFQRVYRMIPVNPNSPEATHAEGDDAAIIPFTQPHGGRRAMLMPANLGSERVWRAQCELAAKIRHHAANPRFKRRFDAAATARSRRNIYGFQIHRGKVLDDLVAALQEAELMFTPGQLEPWDYSHDYFEIHPKLGEAVMSTLAIACAKAQGLDIVAEPKSGRLHTCLIEKTQSQVFDAYLRTSDEPLPEPTQPTARELFEFIVTFRCDTSKLDVQKLATMGGDRKPLERLMKRLAEHAAQLDPMDSGPDRKEQIDAEVDSILDAWRQDRANMHGFWKHFFGWGAVDPGVRFAQKSIDKLGGSTTGLAGNLVGAASGAGIGLLVHGAKSVAATFGGARRSPYRFMTLMEKNGVVFRSDLTPHEAGRLRP